MVTCEGGGEEGRQRQEPLRRCMQDGGGGEGRGPRWPRDADCGQRPVVDRSILLWDSCHIRARHAPPLSESKPQKSAIRFR